MAGCWIDAKRVRELEELIAAQKAWLDRVESSLASVPVLKPDYEPTVDELYVEGAGDA